MFVQQNEDDKFLEYSPLKSWTGLFTFQHGPMIFRGLINLSVADSDCYIIIINCDKKQIMADSHQKL